MKLTAEEIAFIKKTLELFFNKESYKIFIFGSYAKGTARANSDIDIAIQGHEPLPASLWQQAISAFEDSTFSKKIDLVDYHRVTPQFQKIIDRDGHLI